LICIAAQEDDILVTDIDSHQAQDLRETTKRSRRTGPQAGEDDREAFLRSIKTNKWPD
jgi:hypothetical protein